jgi:hypothetical protein
MTSLSNFQDQVSIRHVDAIAQAEQRSDGHTGE